MKVAILVLCTLSAAWASPLSWRIVGGQDAKVGQFPHQISLRYYGSHACGGSILDATTILCAAHCVDGQSPSTATVVVGAHKLSIGGRSHRVKSFVRHADYNRYQIMNDISIIKLATPIEFDENVQPIALPTSNIGAGELVTLSGWGRTSYPGSLPNVLQWIELKTLSVQDCKARLTQNRIFDSEVCTFTRRGQGACHGDSGGPLINANKEVIGIVSWGYPCAIGSPDVFTRVHSFLDWIAENRG